jgi:predicted MPP superfamily phosphohydrolase
VVHTGDLVDGTVEGMGPSVEPLSRMHGKDGTFFVTGNHEAYSGIAPWVRFVQDMGWTVLVNRHVILHRDGASLCLAGVTDAHEGGMVGGIAPDPRAALEGVPAGVPIVLLAHQPRQALQAQGLGVSLQLSGHTHGGQLWPFHYLVRLQQPMVSGLARIGDMQVFTSRGAGFWGPPLRLFAPPEIPILVLRRPA